MLKTDDTLDNLLYLDGYVIDYDGGYRVVIKAKRLKQATVKKPYGIDYSLVLLSPDNKRVIGYDNAHFPGVPAKTPDDHKHKANKRVKYTYTSAEQLLDDFWADVDRVIANNVEK